METKRTFLKNLEYEDLKYIKDWSDDDEITMYMVMGMRPGSGIIYCSWNTLEEEFKKYQSSKDIILKIVDKKTELIVGIVGLYDINWIARNAEIRIVIGKNKFRNKGYGVEVIRELFKYGFNKLNLHKMYLGVNASDDRANNCYKKCGFKYDGSIRHYHYRNGTYYDANFYSILKEEWKNEKN